MLKQWWLKWREPKPFNEGYLPEADGHRIYFAEYGKKGGKPVLLTHGGPGGGLMPDMPRFLTSKNIG
ncbi:MAG: alpha/beta fold hydrolase [Alphaproteobacteria bacterium]